MSSSSEEEEEPFVTVDNIPDVDSQQVVKRRKLTQSSNKDCDEVWRGEGMMKLDKKRKYPTKGCTGVGAGDDTFTSTLKTKTSLVEDITTANNISIEGMQANSNVKWSWISTDADGADTNQNQKLKVVGVIKRPYLWKCKWNKFSISTMENELIIWFPTVLDCRYVENICLDIKMKNHWWRVEKEYGVMENVIEQATVDLPADEEEFEYKMEITYKVKKI